ncbi:MAG: VTT domain-containing protein [Pseudomonadota bacterium]
MKTKILIIAIFASLLGAFFYFDGAQYLSLDALKAQKENLDGFYSDNPFVVGAIYFVAYVIVAAFAIPAAAIVTLAGGAIFGFGIGLLLASFASTIGATIAFLLTRFLFHESVEAKFGDRLGAINSGIEKEGALYVFGLRLVPLFPFFVVNSLLALTKLKTFTFYWASQIGMLAGTAVYVYAGTQLAQISSLSDILSPQLLIAFALLGILPIASKKLMNWLRANSSTTNSATE